jgi:dienelactone hydrolase
MMAMPRRILMAALAAVVLAPVPRLGFAQSEITVTAPDGVTVYADLYAHEGTVARGAILLFHQAGSNAQEYATIAPRLAAMGFDAVAVDQRSGGQMFSGTNRTVKALGVSTAYEKALADMEAALAHVRGEDGGRPVIVWGSSYSASLVFELAARHPGDIAAVMAFSPGEYFAALTVNEAAKRVTVPVYVTSSSSPGEVAEAKAIADAVPGAMAEQVLPEAGAHGSSTLRDDMNPSGAEANWVPVKAFLDRVAPPGG